MLTLRMSFCLYNRFIFIGIWVSKKLPPFCPPLQWCSRGFLLFPLLLKEGAGGIVSWSTTEGCVCTSGGACTCQRRLRQRNNARKISCAYKPYNIFWNLCHRSDLSIKKKSPNGSLQERTHGARYDSHCQDFIHFSTFTDYQESNKNIFSDGTP